ncbi:MAG: TolC family protein [Phycisphaeraceae bacterium]|nr:TolC family protein [Phycisphaeraceae bacterium]
MTRPFIFRLFGFVLMIILASGCQQVDPTGQFQSVQSLDQSRGGNELIWKMDEKDKQKIQAKIDQIMLDGITRDEASAIAVLNNGRLQSAYERLGLAAADITEAGLLRNPTLDGLIAFPIKTGGSSVSLIGVLSDLWLMPKRKELAKTRSTMVELKVASMVLRTSQSSMMAWDDLVSARQRLKLERKLLSIHEQIEKRLQILFNHGLVDTMEVETAKMRYLDQKIMVRNSQATLETATIVFDQLLSYKGAAQKVNVSELVVLGKNDLLDLSNSLETAMKMRLDLMSEKSAIDLSAKRLDLEKALTWNVVQLGVGYDGDFRSINNMNGNTLGPVFSIEIPVFNQNQAGIAARQYKLRNAIKRYAVLQFQVKKEVISNFSKFQAIKSNLKTLETDYTLARKKELEYLKKWNMKMQLSYMRVLDASAISLKLDMKILAQKQDYNRGRLMLEQVMLGGFFQ